MMMMMMMNWSERTYFVQLP